MATAHAMPNPAKMFGICHDADGSALVRVPRVLKVGIGMPRGKDIRVYIDSNGQWKIRVGETVTPCKDIEEAQKTYRAKKAAAPEIKYPRKLEYFTFTRPAGDGTFDPDFEAIEAHGSFPREVDIMFTEDRPLQAEFQMWTASELKCHGDGINALRVLSMANNKEEVDLAKQAAAEASKFFPVVKGCYTCECPYAKPTFKDTAQGKKEVPAPCKPHARIQFQLISAPRLGGVAQFDTTSIRTISQLFSCLHTFYSFTGRGDPEKGIVSGIPLKLVLHPFKVNHNNQPSTAYSVSLEFRAESATKLRQSLIDHAMEFRRTLMPAIPKQITEAQETAEPEEEFETVEAAQFTNEFVEAADEPVPDVPEGGSVEEARHVGILKLSKETGYRYEEIEEFWEHSDCLKRVAAKYGEPSAKPEQPEAGAQETAKPTQRPTAQSAVPAGATPISEPRRTFGQFGKGRKP